MSCCIVDNQLAGDGVLSELLYVDSPVDNQLAGDGVLSELLYVDSPC